MASIISAIADRQRRLADLTREVEAVRDDLAALTRAAQIMGLEPIADQPSRPLGDEPRRGGKPRGAISVKWREILRELHSLGGKHTPADIAALANLKGENLAPSSVRDRLRNLANSGFLERFDDGKYAVATKAVEQFGMDIPKKEAPPSSEGGAL
jgi:hypothetical protein